MSIFILVAAIFIIIGMALSGGSGQHSIKRRINSSRDDSSADFMFYEHMTDSHSGHNDFHNHGGGYDSCHDSGCDCGGSSDGGCGGDGGCDCGGGGCD